MVGNDNQAVQTHAYIMLKPLKPGMIERIQALADISRSALCCHRNETCAPRDQKTGRPTKTGREATLECHLCRAAGNTV